MRLFSDSIGRKVVMAITGLLMVLFVIGHLLGNLTIYAGLNGLNGYAAKLHELVPVVWGTRIVMGAAVLLHLFLSIQITLENSAAKPDRYAVQRHLRATSSSKTMIWTGALMGAFILYHLLHFTFRVTPGLALGFDYMNRFDVYRMVVTALGGAITAFVYVAAMVALFMHLRHGIQSMFQTLGLSNAFLLPKWGTLGMTLAIVFLAGFASIPVFVFFGVISLS